MFPNFSTIPTPAVPSPPPPLVMGMKPKVPSIRGQNESDDDSSAALTLKPTILFFNDNNKPLTHTHIYEYRRATHSPSRQSFLIYWLCNLESEADDLFAFPVLRNINAQGQLIPQHEYIDFSHMQQMKKAVTMYGPYSLLLKSF